MNGYGTIIAAEYIFKLITKASVWLKATIGKKPSVLCAFFLWSNLKTSQKWD